MVYPGEREREIGWEEREEVASEMVRRESAVTWEEIGEETTDSNGSSFSLSLLFLSLL